ncbi:hypothetical protein HUA76_39575 [Myxococcus sp. CA056]|uniref:hypothetical protein n=2 Tax=Myxococcus TaxID=32 RepID=UPI00157B910B|nr:MULTISPECIES: hypothetical protein [unclassified Myxococcus]NTX16892.1 hypothetical protein [Myxococcus sp. CA056]NTX36721.1 hypothetical protein [Myxococcus sp. CA033]
MRAPHLAFLLLLGVHASAPAHAGSTAQVSIAPEEDWFASQYTPGGLEVRADVRVFTLFALLNRAGYDAGPVERAHPVPTYRYGRARTLVREKLATAAPSVLEEARAYFAAHPEPVEVYLARILGGPDVPGAPGDLVGLEALLARVEREWPVAALRAETLPDFRAAQRAWLPLLDGPFKQAARLLGLREGEPAPRVVVNLLEAEGSVRPVDTGRGWVIVVGPATRAPEPEPVVRELARGLLSSRLAGRLGARWAGGAAALKDARAKGAGEGTVDDYGVALLSRALALTATGAPAGAYEAAQREGYFGLKTLSRSFEDTRPVDVWALDGLARAVTQQANRK